MVRSHNAKEIVENVPGCKGKYKLEEYAIFTPDGYILILHRLRFNFNSSEKEQKFGAFGEDDVFTSRMDGKNPPVLLNHGAMMTSEAWLTAPRRMIPDGNGVGIPMTLAHVLLHAGYDVWIMNRRGNKYSCKHTSLSTHHPDFWAFSLDEPACRDLPAVIDFVIELSGFGRVSLIGFSQGAAECLAALSIVRGLESKVNLAVLLAPTTKPRGINNLSIFFSVNLFILYLYVCSERFQCGRNSINCKIESRNCVPILWQKDHAKLRPLLAANLFPKIIRLRP